MKKQGFFKGIQRVKETSSYTKIKLNPKIKNTLVFFIQGKTNRIPLLFKIEVEFYFKKL